MKFVLINLIKADLELEKEYFFNLNFAQSNLLSLFDGKALLSSLAIPSVIKQGSQTNQIEHSIELVENKMLPHEIKIEDNYCAKNDLDCIEKRYTKVPVSKEIYEENKNRDNEEKNKDKKISDKVYKDLEKYIKMEIESRKEFMI